MPEPFVKIKGKQYYLRRGVDQDKEVIDVYLRAKRDGSAAKRCVGFRGTGRVYMSDTLSGTVLLVEILFPDTSTVTLMASQWVVGIIVYSFAVYMLDRSVQTDVQDLLKLGVGKQ